MIEFSLKEGDRLQITGLRALIEIIVQLAFVWLAFFAIQGIHFEHFFNRPPRTITFTHCFNGYWTGIFMCDIFLKYPKCNWEFNIFNSIVFTGGTYGKNCC